MRLRLRMLLVFMLTVKALFSPPLYQALLSNKPQASLLRSEIK